MLEFLFQLWLGLTSARMDLRTDTVAAMAAAFAGCMSKSYRTDVAGRSYSPGLLEPTGREVLNTPVSGKQSAVRPLVPAEIHADGRPQESEGFAQCKFRRCRTGSRSAWSGACSDG